MQTIAGTFGEAFGVYRFDGSISDMKITELGNYYYFVLGYPSLNASKISYVSYLPETSALRSRIVCGAYPVNDDEICISTYTASAMIAADLIVRTGRDIGRSERVTRQRNIFRWRYVENL